MDEDNTWWIILGAALAVGMLSCLVLVAAFGWPWLQLFLAGPASGWAQAIFGAGAIIAAYRMGSAQLRATHQRETENDARRLETIRALMSNALDACTDYRDGWTDPGLQPPQGFAVEHWVFARDALARVDPFQSPTPMIVVPLVQAPRYFDELITAYAEYAKAVFRPDPLKPVPLRPARLRLSARLDKTIAFLEEAVLLCDATAPSPSAVPSCASSAPPASPPA